MVELTQLKAAFFLKEFKMLVQKTGLYAVNRRYHQNALAELGLTRQDRENEILGLSVEDYSDGPRTDRDRPGEVWIFGKKISGREIYIKLKIAEVGSEKIAKCISFHAAEHPFTIHSNDCGLLMLAVRDKGDKKDEKNLPGM